MSAQDKACLLPHGAAQRGGVPESEQGRREWVSHQHDETANPHTGLPGTHVSTLIRGFRIVLIFGSENATWTTSSKKRNKKKYISVLFITAKTGNNLQQ